MIMNNLSDEGVEDVKDLRWGRTAGIALLLSYPLLIGYVFLWIYVAPFIPTESPLSLLFPPLFHALLLPSLYFVALYLTIAATIAILVVGQFLRNSSNEQKTK